MILRHYEAIGQHNIGRFRLSFTSLPPSTVKLDGAKFPEAYEADCKTPCGDKAKLGTFSVAVLPSNFHIYNMYSQFFIGTGKMTTYDAMDDGLRRIEKHAISNGLARLGLPKNMGCVLGGGRWTIVRAIIEDVFVDSSLDLFICNYEG